MTLVSVYARSRVTRAIKLLQVRLPSASWIFRASHNEVGGLCKAIASNCCGMKFFVNRRNYFTIRVHLYPSCAKGGPGATTPMCTIRVTCILHMLPTSIGVRLQFPSPHTSSLVLCLPLLKLICVALFSTYRKRIDMQSLA